MEVAGRFAGFISDWDCWDLFGIAGVISVIGGTSKRLMAVVPKVFREVAICCHPTQIAERWQ